jgi:molecular chaperone DnaJ
MTSREDLYLILQVARAASVNDIKRAFRRLARRYHPDINPGDRTAEEYFKKISEAYDILSDPLKKEFYDQNGFYSDGVLETKTAKAAWGFSFQGFDFSNSGASPFTEMFGQFMSRQAALREPEQGQDLEYQIAVGFAESMVGLKSSITVSRKQACPACQGDGRAATVREMSCPSCHGGGKVGRSKGHLQFAMTCPECGGAGRLRTDCGDCGGDGRTSVIETLAVDIPAGVTTGSRLRFPGKGDVGRHGGPAGDLFLVTNVAPHPFFTRAGDNIQCTVPITFWEAALGAKVEVPSVDGTSVIRIPPGTQSGQTFRMRGKGAPSLSQPGSRGDQFVEVKIIVPKIGDERSKEILRELARLNPGDPRKELPKS